MPSTPFIGVRISWLMVARNSLFAWLAASAASLASLQLRGARHHLLLEPGTVVGEPEVALVDLLEHQVEAAAEGVDLGDAAVLRAHAVVALRHVGHQRAQPAQRHEHGGVEAPEQRPADRQREQHRQQRGDDLPRICR